MDMEEEASAPATGSRRIDLNCLNIMKKKFSKAGNIHHPVGHQACTKRARRALHLEVAPFGAHVPSYGRVPGSELTLRRAHLISSTMIVVKYRS